MSGQVPSHGCGGALPTDCPLQRVLVRGKEAKPVLFLLLQPVWSRLPCEGHKLRLFQQSDHVGKVAPAASRQSSKKESHACSDGKESACSAGDLSSVSGLGRSPGGGNGNPVQYSCLEDSMDRGAWWLLGVHRVGHD